jgi:2-dehydro-3-deoxygluconokinase
MLSERAFKGCSLCVVGNINRDIRTAPLTPGESLFHDGETSVAFVKETIGGGGANSAFAAAAMGAQVTFLGKVGTDGLGERLTRTLSHHRIDGRLARDPVHPTGTSIALAFDTGERHFVSCLPASQHLRFEDLDLSCLANCNHLLRADVWFSEDMLAHGNAALFKAAQAMGVPVSLDLNWDPLWATAEPAVIKARKDSVRAVLRRVDVVHGNIRELCEFTGEPTLDDALRQLTAWGAGAAVVHMGERGAAYHANGKLIVEPPVPARSRTHATGTGDVLSVCMMLLHGRTEASFPERLRWANQIVAEYLEGKRPFIPDLLA